MLANGFDWKSYVRNIHSSFGRVDVYRQGHLVLADAGFDQCTSYLQQGAERDFEFYADMYAQRAR
jgi:hypothetical protein